MSIDENTGFEPDTTPTDLSATDVAADTGLSSDAGGEDPVPKDEDANAAFMAGVEKASENPSADPDFVPGLKDLEPKVEAPKTAADVVADAAAKAEPKVEQAKDQAAPTEPTAEQKAAKEKIEKEIEDEAAELKLRPGSKAATRFHEMATTIKTQAPVMEALTKAGLTDPGKIEEVMQSAARGIEWEETVLASTATPQQFGEMLTIIKNLNGGKVEAKEQTFDRLLDVVKTLGKELGRTVPGMVDPLEDYPDLKTMVENMDITAEAAAEIAHARTTNKAREVQSQQQNQQTELQQATQFGVNQAIEFERQMQAADPYYAAKFQALLPTIGVIKRTVHPSQWAQEIAQAYALLPNPVAVAPAPAPAKPRISHIPARAGVTASNTVKAEPKSDVEAFMMGVERVSNH